MCLIKIFFYILSSIYITKRKSFFIIKFLLILEYITKLAYGTLNIIYLKIKLLTVNDDLAWLPLTFYYIVGHIFKYKPDVTDLIVTFIHISLVSQNPGFNFYFMLFKS